MDETHLAKVRSESEVVLEKLRNELASARELIREDGTIFATGSYGRLEAGPESDLDVFIVVLPKDGQQGELRAPSIDQVRQIRLKSELIIAAEKAGMADFDAGGKFLETHLYNDIVEEVGSPADDYKNTFTGRMLLILESRPVLGDAVYADLKRDSIKSYFGDFEGNEKDFVPYFLINDILRMWRTFCVNYEFFRGNTSDWRIKNLKLKYTRMLTCFSAIIYVSAIYRLNKTVTVDDIEEMSLITPTERLMQFDSDGRFKDLDNAGKYAEIALDALTNYGNFLEFVQKKKAAIKALKSDEDNWRKRSHDFGAKMAELIQSVNGEEGFENPLYRSILV